MYKMVLNGIICFSIAGIIIIGINDLIVKKRVEAVQAIITPTSVQQMPDQPVSTVQKNTELQNVVCESQFFTFKPNTGWNYELITDVVGKDGKKTHSISNINIKIVRVATGSASLAIKTPHEKNPKNTIIWCKADGLYWNPLSIASSAQSNISLMGMLDIKPILLIPSSEDLLQKDYVWTSTITAIINLGFLKQSLDLPLTNTVIAQNSVSKSITIQSSVDFEHSKFNLFGKSSSLKFFYELQNNSGITHASAEAKIAPFIDYQFSLKRR